MGNFFDNGNGIYNNSYVEKSLVGFILGIVSLVTWIIPFVGVVSALCGIVFSKNDLKVMASNSKAKIGLILSVLGLVGSFIISAWFVIFLISASDKVDDMEKSAFENKVEEVANWFKEQYKISDSKDVSVEFTNYCGKEGKNCKRDNITFAMVGGREVLEKVGLNVKDIDLSNSSIKISDKGDVCLILYGSKEGIYSDFSIDNLGGKKIRSSGCGE